MSTRILECQGLPCPQPVLRCKDCIESDPGTEMVILVDNDAACENVTRFLGVKKYEVVSTEKDGDIWKLTARPSSAFTLDDDASAETNEFSQPRDKGTKTLVFIASPVIGEGDDVLGGKLMQNFVSVLPELGSDLWRIILLNGGVKLAITGSPVLDKLQTLEKNGVSILVCGTCLEFFTILDQKQVGETTNMLDVVTSMQLADKVLSM